MAAFTLFPWLWDLFTPVPNQLPGEHTAPAAITALKTIQTHKQSLSNQVTIHSWVERVNMYNTGEVSCPMTSPHHSNQDLHPKPLHPKSWSIATLQWCPACTWSIHSYLGTLRVVTAREHVVLSGSFMSHSMSARPHRHLCGHVSHKRYTVSNVEGWETNLYKPLPQWGSNMGHQHERCMLCALRYCVC